MKLDTMMCVVPTSTMKVGQNSCLMVELMDPDNLRILHRIKVCSLYSKEEHLDDGRFVNFVRKLDSEFTTDVLTKNHYHLSIVMEYLLEWLGQNCHGHWSFLIDYDSECCYAGLKLVFETEEDFVIWMLHA